MDQAVISGRLKLKGGSGSKPGIRKTIKKPQQTTPQHKLPPNSGVPPTRSEADPEQKLKEVAEGAGKRTGEQESETKKEAKREVTVSKEPTQEMLMREKQYDPYKGKTAAEIRFEKAKKERLATVIAQKLKKTHRERIDEYNKKLAKLPEHFDIPRVGPG